MNLNTILKKIIYLIGLVIITTPADAYIVGYSRLKRRDVQIDVLYDVHKPCLSSTSNLPLLSYQTAKSMCFPAEQRFLTALENIDRKQEVDLIWENKPDAPHAYYTEFLGFAYHLTRNRFSTINHILADTARTRFLNLFNVAYPSRNAARINYNTHDYHNPYVLTYDLRTKILGNWDGLVLQRFNEFMNQAFIKIKSYFAPYFNCTSFVDFYDQVPHLSDLADVEMLSHILASQNQRIIVYTGAAHARRLVPFLQSLYFIEEEHQDNGTWGPEVTPMQLNFLDRDCLSVSSGTSNPLSAMPTVVPHYPSVSNPPPPVVIPHSPVLPSNPVVSDPPVIVRPAQPEPVRYIPPTPIAPAIPAPAAMPVVTAPVAPLSLPRLGGMPAVPVSGGAGRRSTKIAPNVQRGRGRQRRSATVRRKMTGVIVKRAMGQKNNAAKRPVVRRGKQNIRRAPAQMREKNAGNRNRRTVGMRAKGQRKRR